MSLKSSNPRILFIQLEFMSWDRAKAWGYTSNLGFEEGFRSNNIDFITIPAIQELSMDDPGSWTSHIRKFCSGKHFDQVWIELVHNNLNEDFLQWLTTIAPVRLAILCESLEYPPDVYNISPYLKQRRGLVESRLKYMTHALAGDEKDVENFNARNFIKTMWLPTPIPERFIFQHRNSPIYNCATFFGMLYGERKKWLELDCLKDLLILSKSPLEKSPYPFLFA